MKSFLKFLVFFLMLQATAYAQTGTNDEGQPEVCGFEYEINNCEVCFTALVQVGSIAHGWNWDAASAAPDTSPQPEFDAITTSQTICHTYDEPGMYIVTHLHADLTCSTTIDLTGCKPPTCEEKKPEITLDIWGDCDEGAIAICVLIDGKAINEDEVQVYFNFATIGQIKADYGCYDIPSVEINNLGSISVIIGECEYIIEEGWPFCFPGGGFAPDQAETIEPFTAVGIFPNPAVDQLQLYNPTETNLVGVLQSIDGKQLQNFDLDAYETRSLAVDQTPNGIYFVKISNPISKEVVRTEKILVSH